MKKLLPLCICLVVSCSLFGQLDTVTTYPTPGATAFGAPGITFEIITSKPIHLHQLEIALNNSGTEQFEIYYRIAGVQHIAGSVPYLNAANGWRKVGNTSITAPFSLLPSPTSGDLDLLLSPGRYGIFAHSISNSNVNFGIWNNTHPTSYTKSGAAVTIHTGPNIGYLGQGPTFYSSDTVNFIGSVIYEELTYLPEDVQVLSIDSPAAGCPGTHNVVVTVRNLGSTRINSLQFNWEVDSNLQTPFTSSQLIDTLGSLNNAHEVQINIGSISLQANQSKEIKVWTSLPNGKADPVPGNDTARAIINTAMNGPYTIDPVGGGDFTTFNEAVDELKLRGICGPVIISAAGGVYNEQVVIDHIPGTSTINTVTFQSDAANTNNVELSYSAVHDTDNYVIKLNGCSHIILDGLYLTNQGTNNTTAIYFENAAHHNIIRNCDLISPLSTSTNRDFSVITAYGESENSHNRIENNYVYGGSYGITFRGTSSSDVMPGLVISGNKVEESYYYGIYVYYTENVLIEKNILVSNSAFALSYGIRLAYGDGFRIEKNIVKSPGIWPIYGIRVEDSEGTPAQRMLIANNIVNAGDPGSSSGSIAGLYVDDCSYLDIAHNNIVIEGLGSSSRAAYLRGDIDNKAINNNFLHYGTGRAFQIDSAAYYMDYNNLASSGSELGFYSGGRGSIPDFTTWQSTPNGAHSLNIDSVFTNLDSMRTCDNRLVGKAIWLNYVTTDIDGEIRHNPSPTIGADEYSLDPLAIDIGDTIMFCEGEAIELKQLNGSIKYGHYSWSTGENTPTIIVTDEGNYILDLTVCSTASDDVDLVEYPDPSVNFDNNDSAYTGITMGFTNLSTGATAYIWDFGDGSTSDSKDAFHSYEEPGTYTVTLSAVGICDTVTVSKEITITPDPTGLAGIDLNEKVIIYPNPARDNFFLQFGNIKSQNARIELIDTKGQVTLDQSIRVNQNSTYNINLNGLERGIYLMRYTSEQGVAIKQVIVQ